MPHRRSGEKSLRQDKKRRLRNLKIKQELKKAIKKLRVLISQNSTAEAKKLLAEVFSKLDKAAKKGIIKKNSAARKKSRLSRALLKATQSDQKPL